MDEESLQLCDWNATVDLELVSLNLWCNMKESTIAQILLNLMELLEFRTVTELTVTDSPDHVDLKVVVVAGLTVAEVTGSNTVSITEDELMQILILVLNFLPGQHQVINGG
ncbi:hypothetical protein FXO37_17157 [Capsicum annuum]|nr:hypothetical protein FXO37_17157 [Capsicum annuum]